MRDELLNIARVRTRDLKVAALVTRRVAGFAAVEMALSTFALQKLTALGELDALGDGLGGLLLHRGWVRTCARR